MSSRIKRYTVSCIALLAIAGCAHSPREPVPTNSYSVYITGYDVPQPANVPFTDELDRREYLRFYHAAYLGTMWESSFGGSSITPISDRPDAAIAGYYAGQKDAQCAKRAYWAERGRDYGWATD